MIGAMAKLIAELTSGSTPLIVNVL